jgi:predicted MPP superfamily phosphohydrolase
MGYQLREVSVPILPSGSRDIRILHFSDLHLTPRRKREIAEIKSWASYKPDLVISTGDFLAHPRAIETALDALDGLLDFPGLYVFGSNDYYAPRFKNPISYLRKDHGTRILGSRLDTDLLEQELTKRGWLNLNNRRSSITIKGITIDVRGTGDAHLGLDDYSKISGKPRRDISIGVTHAPYKRVLDAMQKDLVDVVFAGHTHGGQIRVPWFGGSRSLTTNCDLPNWRSRGLTKVENEPWLNVSAGMGYSPFTPIRVFCPSEISLVKLMTSQPSTNDS